MREIVSNVVILTLVPALHPALGRTLALPCPLEITAEVGKDPSMVVVTLIAVGPSDDVAVDQDVMCTVLSGPLGVVLALGLYRDVQAIDLALGAGPLVIPGEVMVMFVENLGRTVTVCVPVALDHHHIPGLGLALVPCRTRPIPDLAGVEVVLGRLVGGEGVTVVMILGIAGQGLHANHDFQLLYYKHVLRYSWYAVSIISQKKGSFYNRPLEFSIFPSIIGRICIVVSKEWAGIELVRSVTGTTVTYVYS